MAWSAIHHTRERTSKSLRLNLNLPGVAATEAQDGVSRRSIVGGGVGIKGWIKLVHNLLPPLLLLEWRWNFDFLSNFKAPKRKVSVRMELLLLLALLQLEITTNLRSDLLPKSPGIVQLFDHKWMPSSLWGIMIQLQTSVHFLFLVPRCCDHHDNATIIHLGGTWSRRRTGRDGGQ